MALKKPDNRGLLSLTAYKVAPMADGRTAASVTIHNVSEGFGIVMGLAWSSDC